MLNTLVHSWCGRLAARRLQRDGVVVLRGLLDDAALAEVEAGLARGWNEPALGLLASIPPDATNVPATPDLQAHPGIRLLDSHWALPAVRRALLHPRLVACLAAAYRAAPVLFQSQTFATSPGAPWHRDEAYLALRPNRSLMAVWVALEDVGPGQGGLEYVPGSHRIPRYAFGGQRDWFTPPLDDADEHQRFIDYLRAECQRGGLPTRGFHARAGDALVFDGALVHRSAPAGDRPPSRRSLTAHYCSAEVAPRYLDEGAGQLAAAAVNGARYASGYCALTRSPSNPVSV